MPTADHGHGDRWQVRWRDDGGNQRKQNFARRADADSQDTKTRADLSIGSYVDPRAGKISLGGYVREQWLPAQLHLAPNSADLYAQHIRAHIEPALGNRALRSIQAADLKSFVSVLTGSLAPSTVHTVFAVLRAVLSSAVDDKLIAANPCARRASPHRASCRRSAPPQ